MTESNELSMHITMYLYPNIFLNSEVLSSFSTRGSGSIVEQQLFRRMF